MRTKITIEDSLLAHARALSGLHRNGPLIHAALHALIHRESALRLASLAGPAQDMKYGSPRPDFDL